MELAGAPFEGCGAAPNLMNVELDDETRELLGEPSNWTPPPTDGWKRRLKAE